MLNVRKQLPQLDPLVAFEAAARLSSFAEAAKELNVTPSAVSQQIRTLEQQLGVSLFKRGHRSVQLTARGVDFQSGVSVALMHLVNAASEVRNADPTGRLELAVDSAIASMWLVPRLERFEREHPEMTVRVEVTDVQSELMRGPFDLAIVHGDGTWQGHESACLFEEEVFPVCAPAYLEGLGATLSPETISQCALLDLEYERWHWMNWAIWLTEMGWSLPETSRKLRTNNYTLMIDAARQGLGVALGWRHFVDEDLAAGTLVRPVESSVTTRFAYYLLWPYNRPLVPAAAAFRDWLLASRMSLQE